MAAFYIPCIYVLNKIDIPKKKRTKILLKFGDSDGPNLCRVKKVDVSSTFIENIFRSGLTLVSSNDIITIKIHKKIEIFFARNHKKISKQER